jgi:hypothetical protein
MARDAASCFLCKGHVLGAFMGQAMRTRATRKLEAAAQNVGFFAACLGVFDPRAAASIKKRGRAIAL